MDIVAEFAESTERTTKPGRPVFRSDDCPHQEGEASGILVWNPDRLARNPIDGGQIMYLIDTGAITHLESPTFWFQPTPQGMLMLAIAFGMSKYYTDSLSQNIKRGLHERAKAGFWPWHAACSGYIFDRNTRTVIPDPEQAPLIRRTFELYATGEYTLDRLLQVMTVAGLRARSHNKKSRHPLSRSRLYDLLQSPFFLGMYPYNGELREAKHEPLIPQSLFDKCQAVIHQRGKIRTLGLKPFLYRGMFRCGECGCTVTLEVQKGIRYLRCTKQLSPCTQRYLREDHFVAQLQKAIATVIVPEQTVSDMIDALKLRQKDDSLTWAKEVARIRAKVTSYDEKVSRLTTAYIDGILPLHEFRQDKERVLMQKRSWAEKLTFLDENRNTRLEPLIRFIRGLTEPRLVVESGDLIQQRDFFENIASNPKILNKRVVWTGRGAWEHVAGPGYSADRPRNALSMPGSANARFPVMWSTPNGTRTLLKALCTFFEDHPTWN